MKSFGYATGQFGKNHLGDRNEHLPTVHGFDEFFGNLYHLNAEEEPENPDYPKDPDFRRRFGPRGVLKCKASDRDDASVDPAFGRVGKQTIENTGPLDSKRMETVDEEFLAAAKHTGERYWHMPYYEEYSSAMKSEIADLKNTGGRAAGTLTAGAFLRAFVDETPWIHLDIAGTAYVDTETAWQAKGPTGTPVRALVSNAGMPSWL